MLVRLKNCVTSKEMLVKYQLPLLQNRRQGEEEGYEAMHAYNRMIWMFLTVFMLSAATVLAADPGPDK